MNLRKLAPAILFACSAPAFSMPVTFQSQWFLVDVQNSYELVTENATVTFTYEDSTKDIEPDQWFGVYENALLAMTFAFDGEIYSLNSHQVNYINIHPGRGSLEPELRHPTFGIYAGMVDSRGRLFDFAFGADGYTEEYHSDSLKEFSEWINIPTRDAGGIGLTPHGAGWGEDFQMYTGDLMGPFVRRDNPVSVPEPVSAGLAGLGIAAIAFARRRRQAA